MSATNYKRYVEETLALAKSITLKDEASIIGINQHIESLGYTITNDPKTWKYYLNISGNYHFLDLPMEIVSLDTQEVIPFTKEALAVHPTTKAYYKVGSSYYLDLVNKFPEQELLIRGIINPINVDKAIAAQGYEILFIDYSLIEENELNLVDELQTQIFQFTSRWDNPSFRATDDLYGAAQLSILYLNIPLFIFNIRLANCKTNYVHSFHINEYLKSHSRLDVYTNYLTKKQKLFLYRNINYLQKNAGKRSTFNMLMQRILTERGIGLAEFRINHKLDELITNLKPGIEVMRNAINPFHSSYRSDEHTLEELLYKERYLTTGNLREEEKTIATSKQSIQHSKRDNLPTKVLESAIIDWSESGPVIRSEFLLNHWAYLASTGIYNTLVRVVHPRTGLSLDMSSKDAFLIFLYAFNKGQSQTLNTIPKITARFVRRHPLPSFNTLRSICDKAYVPDDLVQMAALESFDNTLINTTEKFVKRVDGLYKAYYRHREVYALQEHFKSRGHIHGLFYHLYMTADCPFIESDRLYSEWFNEKGFDFDELTNLEFETLAGDILENATGVNYSDSFSTHEIQKSLVQLMDQLTSYNIHFLRESNVGNILYWDWPAIRFGDMGYSGNHLVRASMLPRIPNGASFYGKLGFKIALEKDVKLNINTFGWIRHSVNVPPALNPKFNYIHHFKMKVPSSRYEIKNVIEI